MSRAELGEAHSQQQKAAEELLAAHQSIKVLQNERDVLAKEVEISRSAEEAGDTYADSMKETYEAQIKEMNEEVLTLQTTMLQMKNQLKAALKADTQRAASPQKDLLQATAATAEPLSPEQQESVCQELLAAQQSSKVLSNERDMLAKQVEALKAEGTSMSGLYMDSMKVTYQAQISQLNEEVATLQAMSMQLKGTCSEMQVRFSTICRKWPRVDILKCMLCKRCHTRITISAIVCYITNTGRQFNCV